MRRIRFAMVLTILFGLGLGGSAWAYTIAVLRPDGSDQMLLESFSRLCGELRMYGLQVRLLDGVEGAELFEKAAGQSGNSSNLVGGVSLLRTPGQATARIWVAANAAGKESVRITVSVDGADAPSLLAIRAADLLRASLRDLHGADLGPQPDVASRRDPDPNRDADAKREHDAKREQDTSAASPAQEASAAPRRRDPLTVQVGPTALFEVGELGTGWGANVQVQKRLSHRLALALAFTAPIVGQTYYATGATAHVRQELATIAIALRLMEGQMLNVDLFQGIGVMHLSVHGEAPSPWVAQDSSAWAAASSTGAAVSVPLSEHWGLSASLAAIFLAPRPIIDVADVSYLAHQPFLQAHVGLYFGF